MPDVRMYIRSEDWDKWQAIENKPEWLHEHLNAKEFKPSYVQDGKKVTIKTRPGVKQYPPNKELKIPKTGDDWPTFFKKKGTGK